MNCKAGKAVFFFFFKTGQRKSPSFITLLNMYDQLKNIHYNLKNPVTTQRPCICISYIKLKIQSLHFLWECSESQAQRLSGSSNPHMGNKYHVGQDLVRDQGSSLWSCELYNEKLHPQNTKQVLIWQFRFVFQDTLNRWWSRVHHLHLCVSLLFRLSPTSFYRQAFSPDIYN